MCDAYGSSYGETDLLASSSSTRISGSTKMRPSSSVDDATRSQMRVRHASEDLGLQIRVLARSFTVREFIDLRAKIEDVFDSVLLAGRV
jgi:hypothetical protein